MIETTTPPIAQAEPEQTVEVHGIAPIAPSARTHTLIADNFNIWMSANMVISTLAIGVLATSVFQLGFWDSVVAIVLFNVLGVLPVALLSTFGPKLGLRQMTISRFSFGWVGAGIMALFNVVACIGWGAVDAIVGGQLLTALSGGAINRPLAILLIAVVTTILAIYGYKYIHRYARFAWIPVAAIFVALFALTSSKVVLIPTPAFGIIEIASFVSFGGAVCGFALGWSSYASDYSVYQPRSTSSTRVFWYTFLGELLPCIFLEIFGVALTTIFKGATSGADVLTAAAQPMGWIGSALLVVLALSTIANNIPNAYSLGLSMQVLGGPLQRVSRSIWTLFGSVLYMLIAIPAVADFNGTLTDFMLIIAYWLGPWSIIVIEEHLFFRRGKYNLEDWNTPEKLPIGFAALAALFLGLVGVYLGAAQAIFVGPVANLFNPPYGMDIGFELGALFAGLSYPLFRKFELTSFRR